jgi:hypothetical protein
VENISAGQEISVMPQSSDPPHIVLVRGLEAAQSSVLKVRYLVEKDYLKAGRADRKIAKKLEQAPSSAWIDIESKLRGAAFLSGRPIIIFCENFEPQRPIIMSSSERTHANTIFSNAKHMRSGDGFFYHDESRGRNVRKIVQGTNSVLFFSVQSDSSELKPKSQRNQVVFKIRPSCLNHLAVNEYKILQTLQGKTIHPEDLKITQLAGKGLLDVQHNVVLVLQRYPSDETDMAALNIMNCNDLREVTSILLGVFTKVHGMGAAHNSFDSSCIIINLLDQTKKTKETMIDCIVSSWGSATIEPVPVSKHQCMLQKNDLKRLGISLLNIASRTANQLGKGYPYDKFKYSKSEVDNMLQVMVGAFNQPVADPRKQLSAHCTFVEIIRILLAGNVSASDVLAMISPWPLIGPSWPAFLEVAVVYSDADNQMMPRTKLILQDNCRDKTGKLILGYGVESIDPIGSKQHAANYDGRRISSEHSYRMVDANQQNWISTGTGGGSKEYLLDSRNINNLIYDIFYFQANGGVSSSCSC